MSRPLPAFLPPLPDLGQRVGRSARDLPAGLALPAPPLPTLPGFRTEGTYYDFTRTDHDGRLALRRVSEVLAWRAEAVLAAVHRGPSIVISPSPGGSVKLLAGGFVRLPLALRLRCRLTAGAGVLLAASPSSDQLVCFPPSALDGMVSDWAARTGGGAT